MLRSTYKTLCSIEQQHTYFQDPSTPSVAIVPVAGTVQAIYRAGLLGKILPAGPVMLRMVPEEGSARPLPAFLFPLRFQLQPINPYFENFTELPSLVPSAPSSTVSCIFYFSVPSVSEAGGSTRVELKAADGLLLPLTPLTLTFQPISDAVAKLRVRLVTLNRQEPLQQVLPLDEAGCATIDLRRWGSGRYQLKAGNKVLYDFYADEQLYATRAWGVLDIGAAALPQGPLSVQLRFTARYTRWQYLLQYKYAGAEKYRQAAASLSITAVGSPPLPALSFEQVPPPPGVDVAFVSREAIALAERPAYNCTLRFALPAPVVVARLPGAGVEMVRPAPGPSAVANTIPGYSDIFVHL